MKRIVSLTLILLQIEGHCAVIFTGLDNISNSSNESESGWAASLSIVL